MSYFSISKMVQYEHTDNEELQNGTPQWWDNYLLRNIFQENRSDFRKPFDLEDQALLQIHEMNPNTILLRYNSNGEISLNIYGTNVAEIFWGFDISKFDNQNDTVIYRKP